MQDWKPESATCGALKGDLGSTKLGAVLRERLVGRSTGLYAVLCAELQVISPFPLRCLLGTAASG